MRTFIVFGTEREPVLKLLTPSQVSLFYTRTMIVEDMRKAVAASFGAGYEHALPAWDVTHPGLIAIAQGNYQGPHEMRLKAIAAAVVLGIALEDLPKGAVVKLPAAKESKDDGSRAPLVPVTPTMPPQPVGAVP